MSKCWIFEGAKDRHGYGRVKLPGGRHMPTRFTHRLVFEAIYGWLPPVVMHRCDNPPCYNPAHLLPGTQADNMHDMARKGRRKKPTNNRPGGNHP